MSTAVIPAEAAVEYATPLQLVNSTVSEDKREENRWLLGFGLPCLAAGLFVAAAIGSGHAWLLGLRARLAPDRDLRPHVARDQLRHERLTPLRERLACRRGSPALACSGR